MRLPLASCFREGELVHGLLLLAPRQENDDCWLPRTFHYGPMTRIGPALGQTFCSQSNWNGTLTRSDIGFASFLARSLGAGLRCSRRRWLLELSRLTVAEQLAIAARIASAVGRHMRLTSLG